VAHPTPESSGMERVKDGLSTVALVFGYWRAASPLGWLSGAGLGRIEELRTRPWRERPYGL
jgi:hypothetical protein